MSFCIYADRIDDNNNPVPPQIYCPPFNYGTILHISKKLPQNIDDVTYIHGWPLYIIRMENIAPNIEHYIGYNNYTKRYRHIFRFDRDKITNQQLFDSIKNVNLNESTINGQNIIDKYNNNNNQLKSLYCNDNRLTSLGYN